MITHQFKKGSLLIEIVVASGIIALAFTALLSLQSVLISAKRDGADKVRATYRAEEALEAVRYMRDNNTWTNFTSPYTAGATYYVATSSPTGYWTLTPTAPSLLHGLYTRKVVFSNVQRNTLTNEIDTGACSGGCYADADTRKVTVTVEWQNGLKKVVIEMYLTKWKELFS